VKYKSLNKTTISYAGGTVGCLLLHGFTSHPGEMQELGQFLADKNMTIRIPLLPGHGTIPSDLAKVKWTDWFNLVRNEFLNLKTECREIFIIGQSMGGTLALHLGSHYKVTAIISYAAPVQFERPLMRFIPLIQKFWRYYPKKHGNDISDPEARKNHLSYPVYPMPTILEFQHLIRHTFDDLPEITTPILVAHSKNDHTIPPQNAEVILRRVRSQEKAKLVFEKSYHLLTLDLDKKTLFEKTYAFMKRQSMVLK
jgi:carboxylesterase